MKRATSRPMLRLGLALLAMAGVGRVVPAGAADPVRYDVTLTPTGQAALDGALHDSSQLIALQKSAPTGPFGLVTRARTDATRFLTALQSFGWYDATVALAIDGLPADDPALPDHLQALPAEATAKVTAKITLGPLFHLRKVELTGTDAAAARQALAPLAPGAAAIAADVLAAQQRLLSALREDGHAFARVPIPRVTEDRAAHVLDVVFSADPGPRVDIGAITLTGLDHTNPGFVRRRLLIHPSEEFRPSRIEAARQDLESLGVFAGVQASTADHPAADGSLPVTFAITERKRNAVSATAAYSTDLGGSLGGTYTRRDLFGNAETLDLGAAVTELGGSATRELGYDLSARFTRPDFLARDQTLSLSAEALREALTAYTRTAAILGGAIARKFGPHWSASAGITATEEAVTQEGIPRDYTLLGLPLSASYDSTNSLFDPSRGIKFSGTVVPTASFAHSSAGFAILRVSASTYLDLGALFGAPADRSVLALRALVGSVQGATDFELPPDQRFYGGGSATVRGFKYQSVGPRFPDQTPTGGTAIDAGSIEYRQRIPGILGGNLGAVAFVDAGQVSAQSAPFTGDTRIGAGLGLRYFTPIGPIRLDAAMPLNPRRGDDTFELYIGLGQAF